MLTRLDTIRRGRAVAPLITSLVVLAGVAGCGSDAVEQGSAAAPSTPASTVVATLASPLAPTEPTLSSTSLPSTGESATEAPTTTEPASTAPTAMSAPVYTDANVVDIELGDFTIKMPDTVPSGPTKFVATNSGKEEHHATLVKLNDGVTFDQALGAFAADPKSAYALVTFIPGPNAVAPGDEVVTWANLVPGNYGVLCVIPSADGVPHAAKGMLMPLTVTEGPIDDPVVGAADSVVLFDHRFELPAGGLHAGMDVRINNAGDQPHEFVLYRVDDDAKATDAVAFLTSPTPPPGPPPFTPAGGITAMNAGQIAAAKLDVEPGTYVAICFLPDKSDNAPHFTKGMVQVLEIAA